MREKRRALGLRILVPRVHSAFKMAAVRHLESEVVSESEVGDLNATALVSDVLSPQASNSKM